MVYPPQGHHKACSALKLCLHTQFAGKCFKGHPYLKCKASTNTPLVKFVLGFCLSRLQLEAEQVGRGGGVQLMSTLLDSCTIVQSIAQSRVRD